MPIEFGPLSGYKVEDTGRALLAVSAFGVDGAAANSGACNMLAAYRMSAQDVAIGTVNVAVPDSAYLSATLLVAGSDASYSADQQESAYWMKLGAFDAAPGNDIAHLAYRARIIGRELPEVYARAFYVERPGMMISYAGLTIASIADRMWFGHDLEPRVIGSIRDILALQVAHSHIYEGSVRARDVIAFGEQISWTILAMRAEGMVFGSTSDADFTQLVKVLGRLVLGGSAANTAEAVLQVLDALVFSEATQALNKGEVSDTLVLASLLDSLYSAVSRALETMLLGDRPVPHFTMFVIVRDSLALGGLPAHAADLVAVLRDSIGFMATLSIDNGEYIAWVMNTESKGLSRYTNFPFNSFACIDGRYCGATSAGLYWLDGPDDAGEPIAARLRVGMSAMGTRKLKRMPEAFIGYTSDGTLLLRAIVSDETTGEKNAALYRIQPRPAAVLRENRVKLGRGLCAVDWDFEIENVDGAAFDIRSIEFRPLILDRRTRG